MSRLRWMLERVAGGRPGLLALLLLLLGLTAGVARLEALWQQLQQAREQLALAELRGSAVPDGTVELPWEQAAAQRLEAFRAHFRTGQAIPELLAALHRAALAEGLALERADYRLIDEGAGPLMRYELVLPVSGPYPGLRRFIDRALAQLPVLALDQVSFERPTIAEARVQARLRFTFHLPRP